MTSPASRPISLAGAVGLVLYLLAVSSSALADPGTKTISTTQSFDETVGRLEKAIIDNKMSLVAEASASKGAASRGIKIPGNTVLMVYRNDYAVRMLKASVPAGIEAPLRIYVTENANGSNITYRSPSATFAPYKSAELDALASELDPIFDKIVADATNH
jgi:uncharacterized protein (DUF302 family)